MPANSIGEEVSGIQSADKFGTVIQVTVPLQSIRQSHVTGSPDGGPVEMSQKQITVML